MQYNVTLRVRSSEQLELDDAVLVDWATTALPGRVLARTGAAVGPALQTILRTNRQLRQALAAAYLSAHPDLMTKGTRRDERRRRLR